MIDIAEARRRVLAAAVPLEPERVPIRAALGRVLAEEVAAADPNPPFDNSAMDGYAVRAADLADPPVSLPVVAESRAGHPAPQALEPGAAIAISTGAVVPEGADAVVRVEDTDGGEKMVELRVSPAPGKNIRRAGEDVEVGRTVLRPGVIVGAVELGVLAMLGVAEVSCARRSSVAVLSTGDELVEPGVPLGPGQIRNSNAHALPVLAAATGAEVATVAQVPDEAEATRAALGSAIEADVTLVCGGVSVGRHDHVRPALDALGVEQRFWGVALRPGKPTYFGTVGERLVFGLPGNPVSAVVTFLLFARPALLAMQGADPASSTIAATLAEPVPRMEQRDQMVRVTLDAGPGGWRATATGPQGSHVLTSLLGADGLALIAAGSGHAEAGSAVAVELLASPR